MGNKAMLISAVMLLVLFFGCAAQPPYVPLQANNTTSALPAAVVAAPAIKGPVSDAVVFKIINKTDAADAILSGAIDYYMDSLPVEDVARLQNDSRASLYPASASIYGFYVNPAPAPVGGLNPLSIQKVRFALEYLIDRDAVVGAAFGGLAKPTAMNPWPGHPSYGPISSVVEGYNITADPTKAESLINEGMEGAGAVKVSGNWTYNGKPVEIRISSTDHDEYKAIVGIIAESLGNQGFAVDVSITGRNDTSAFPPYSTDPAKLEWHIAPSGWLYYDASGHAPASTLEIGEGEAGWWAYNNTAINAILEKMKDCQSEAEWEMLDGELAGAYLNDSTGVWLAVPDSTYGARKEVKGLVEDKFTGIRTYPNIREAYVAGKGTLTLGTPGIYYAGEPWNPVVINNIFMMDVVNSIYDPVIRADPQTLEKGPFRWGFAIEGSPSASIPVPSDAFAWNYASKEWVSIGSGKVAKTKVTYDLSSYIGAKWHHGQNITWADVLYFTASAWDRSYDEKKQEISSARWQSTFDPIVGIRISGNSLEVYLSEWSVDKDELLSFARMFQRAAPLEEYAAMDSVVFGGANFSYQYGESSSNISSLSLINESHVREMLIAAHSLTFAGVSPMVTAGGKSYLTQGELSARVSALDAWGNAHKHLIINDGPFYLDRYDAQSGDVYLKAFRDSSYPYPPGHWKQG